MSVASSNTHSLLSELQRALPPGALLTARRDLEVYGYDATLHHGLPDAVALPETTQQVAEVVRACRRWGVAVVPRGSATSLSGGPIPARGGVVVALTRMNRIIEIDEANMRATVQPGLINADLDQALAPLGLMYAPDPASQIACSMGGNVAENAGGPHCLKYGVTANHVTGLTVVDADGRVHRLGSKALAAAGLDLRGLIIGSEGTLAIVTEIVCRLLPAPPALATMLACFQSIEEASQAVSDIIAAGLLPATVEMIDRVVIEAVEKYEALGYPQDVEAVLVIEIDGLASALPPQIEKVQQICRRNGAVRFEWAADDEQRERLWRGRKGATAALAAIAPAKLSTDVTVPRSRLPEALAEVARISRKFQVPIGNVFHAGDGNLHPQVLFDPRDQDQMARAIAADEAITEMALRLGGVLTGEHGVGSEKRKYMTRAFGRLELEVMWAVKDAFDPAGILNPDKVLPDRREVEAMAPVAAAGVFDLAPGPVEVASALEAAEVLASCGRGGVAVHCSAQSRLGPEAADVDVVVACADVLDYDPDNLTITVGAGMTVGQLRAIAGAHGQTVGAWRSLPADVTVGALVALAWPTASCPRYGLPRDFVLGLSVATPRGPLRLGSSCVKNVAGYALERLFIGNCCTLGIVTAATLRTVPLPRAQRVVAFRGRLQSLAEMALWLAGQPLPVEWFRAWPEPSDELWLAAVALAGYPEEIEEGGRAILDAAGGHGLEAAECPEPMRPPVPDDDLWAVAAPPAAMAALASGGVVEMWPLAGIAWMRKPPDTPAEDTQVLSLRADRVLPGGPMADAVGRLKSYLDPDGVLPPWRRQQ